MVRILENLEVDSGAVHDNLAGVLEVHGHPVVNDRLDLTDAPVGLVGMADQHARYQVLRH